MHRSRPQQFKLAWAVLFSPDVLHQFVEFFLLFLYFFNVNLAGVLKGRHEAGRDPCSAVREASTVEHLSFQYAHYYIRLPSPYPNPPMAPAACRYGLVVGIGATVCVVVPAVGASVCRMLAPQPSWLYGAICWFN